MSIAYSTIYAKDDLVEPPQLDDVRLSLPVWGMRGGKFFLEIPNLGSVL